MNKDDEQQLQAQVKLRRESEKYLLAFSALSIVVFVLEGRSDDNVLVHLCTRVSFVKHETTAGQGPTTARSGERWSGDERSGGCLRSSVDVNSAAPATLQPTSSAANCPILYSYCTYCTRASTVVLVSSTLVRTRTKYSYNNRAYEFYHEYEYNAERLRRVVLRTSYEYNVKRLQQAVGVPPASTRQY